MYYAHSKLCPPLFLLIRLSYKYGGLIIDSSHLYPPFLAVECARETAWQNCSLPSHAACDEAHSGSALLGKGS